MCGGLRRGGAGRRGGWSGGCGWCSNAGWWWGHCDDWCGEGGTAPEEEEFKAEAEIGIAAAGFDAAQGVGEAEEGFARAASEADGGAATVGKVETGGELGGVARHGAAPSECSVESAADEVGKSVGNDAGVAAARLELGEDREPGGSVGVEDGAGEALNAIGAWEAEKLFDVSRLERVDP